MQVCCDRIQVQGGGGTGKCPVCRAVVVNKVGSWMVRDP